MTPLTAILRSGTHSRALSATLLLESDALVLRYGHTVERLPLAECRVAARLSNIPRTISTPDGRIIEVADNDALDAMLLAAGHGGRGLAHRLESHSASVAIAALGTMLLLWWFFASGVPQIAAFAAQRLPDEVERRIGEEVLQGMVQHPLFEPSRIEESQRNELLSRWLPLTAQHDLRVHFYSTPRLGANAFALPGRHILVTDALVALAQHDDEILAVLAHEAGHVVHHHPMRSLLSSSLTALLLTALLGDASALTGVLVAAPTILIDAAYSRRLEREADDYAVNWMREHDIDPERFAAILLRMSEAGGGDGAGFLSSHPATAERVTKVRASPSP